MMPQHTAATTASQTIGPLKPGGKLNTSNNAMRITKCINDKSYGSLFIIYKKATVNLHETTFGFPQNLKVLMC